MSTTDAPTPALDRLLAMTGDGDPQDTAAPPPDGAPTTKQVSTSAPASSTSWIAWTVAAALAIVAGFALLQMVAVSGPAGDLDDARAAAADYVLLLSTWDATDGLDDTYLALRDGGTAGFATQLDEVFGEQVRDELVAIDAVSAGTVTGVFGDEVDEGLDGGPDMARVVVLVEQVIVTGPTADPIGQVERAAMVTLERTDDTWLVSSLEMLSELEIVEEDTA